MRDKQNIAAFLSEKDKGTPGSYGLKPSGARNFATAPRIGLPEVVKPPSIPKIPNATPWTPYRKKKDTII